MRLVADTVRGKKADDAITSLKFLNKKSAQPMEKLIRSAVANAKELKIDVKNLKVEEVRVDGGAILYRRGSASHGRAPLIRKRTSHIAITLTTDNQQPMVEKKTTLRKKKVVGGGL